MSSNMYEFRVNKNVEKAWNYFQPLIGNVFGTAALVGALYFRSGMDSYYGWGKYGAYPSMEDESFRKTFIHDKNGFGIVRWTNWIRKQSLFNFCKAAGKYLYDINIQLDFTIDELDSISYGPVLNALKEAASVREAAYAVYDNYLDMKKQKEGQRDICADIAMKVYEYFVTPKKLMVPVKYVKAAGPWVRVKGQKRRKFPFIRKTLGYLDGNEYYRFISASDDCKEYSIYFDEGFGFVDASKVQISIRMEEI